MALSCLSGFEDSVDLGGIIASKSRVSWGHDRRD